jgi:hypothetical protein
MSATWRLCAGLYDATVAVLSETLAVGRSLVCESPRGRRLLLAANLLQGNPTAYRMDFRDGAPVVAGGTYMVAECTLTNTPHRVGASGSPGREPHGA